MSSIVFPLRERPQNLNDVYIHPHFVPAATASLPVDDLALQRGYGVFDFFKVVKGEPVFLDDHLQRLASSARAMHLSLPLSNNELKEKLQELLQRNEVGRVGVRITLTGGSGGNGYRIGAPALIMSVQPYDELDEALFQKGITLMSVGHRRQFPSVKTIDYLMGVWLGPQLKEGGFDDALYHDGGWVSETPRANIFAFINDTLVTPNEGALAGITRSKILQLAGKHYPVEERPLHLDELKNAGEVFITSTTKEVLPVGRIDNTVLPLDRSCARLLREALRDLIRTSAGK